MKTSGTKCQKDKSIVSFIIIVILIVLFDHLTKYYVLKFYGPAENFLIARGNFSITLVKNTGAAFGIFKGISFFRGIFIFFSLAALFAVFFFRKYFLKGPLYFFMGVSFLAGGTIGNLIDRIFRGYVVDFIDVDIPDINVEFAGIFLDRWPVFNIADSCICAGTFLILFYLWRHDIGKSNSAEDVKNASGYF